MDEIEKKVYKDGYRPSNPQSYQHISAVKAAYNHMLNGGTRSTTFDVLQNDGLGLGIAYSYKQAERIYTEAKDLIIADFEDERKYTKSRLLACLNDIYTDARNASDRTNAINAIKEMSKLLDLYEDNKKQSLSIKTNDTEVKISFGFDNNDDDIINMPNNNKQDEIIDFEVVN